MCYWDTDSVYNVLSGQEVQRLMKLNCKKYINLVYGLLYWSNPKMNVKTLGFPIAYQIYKRLRGYKAPDSIAKPVITKSYNIKNKGYISHNLRTF